MSLPRYWRIRKQRYCLIGDVCRRCGTKHFPPREICPECSRPAGEILFFGRGGGDQPYLAIEQALGGGGQLWPYPMLSGRQDLDQAEVEAGRPLLDLDRQVRSGQQESAIPLERTVTL